MTEKFSGGIESTIHRFVRAVLGKKALDLTVLDVRHLTSVADAFIICSGRSHRQVTAIAEHVLTTLKKKGVAPLNVEGRREGHWVLMDYGDVIIHIFYEPMRAFYDLESLWIDAPRIDPQTFNKANAPTHKDAETQPMLNGKRCMLMILDGWGENPDVQGNAVKMAATPFLDELSAAWPRTSLVCSGEAVGLPKGIMGNSEVGHLNIGAGRVVYQELLRIDMAIQSGDFFKNTVLCSAMRRAQEKQSALHLLGLVSAGGVHSQLDHLKALLDMARQHNLPRVYVHAIMDGRDTSPHAGRGYIQDLQAYMASEGTAQIASVCGRYYAMDRDKRWDRTQKAYDLLTRGDGRKATDATAALADAYARDETDEFVKPVVMVDADQEPLGCVKDGDALVFFNFRADRARQLTRAFTSESFDGFERSLRPQLSDFVCMTRYDEDFTLPVAFEPAHLENILGRVVSDAGLQQLRIAETEKYAHVTYFFNGGEESPFDGEDRCLIPSPREVATYDLKPEMSAPAVAQEAVRRLDADRYDVVILNFANMDMVGHTGVIPAAVRAVETVDRCARDVVTHAVDKGWAVIVTADHGNAEKMLDEKGTPHTAHTLNTVPLILVDGRYREKTLRRGCLGDIAPTMLEIMGLKQPPEMTGTPLLKKT